MVLHAGRILISESAILLWIKYFQQSCSRITLEAFVLEAMSKLHLNPRQRATGKLGLTSLSTSSSRKTGLLALTVFSP